MVAKSKDVLLKDCIENVNIVLSLVQNCICLQIRVHN